MSPSKSALSEPAKPTHFADRLVAWQRVHGRRNLPWQSEIAPYRVWVSEVMLQQTQVATVLDYFERFMQRFPSVQHLAQATQDEVFALWSGLGYYARARNMHLCAQRVVREFGGVFPQQWEELKTLPGIGPSTAAAIASICWGERVPIMDANVRRVLTRYFAYGGDLAKTAHVRELTRIAQNALPISPLDMPTYTQGIMDLGATLCTTKKPGCGVCPLAQTCAANKQGQVQAYPFKSKHTKRSSQSLWMLCFVNKRGDLWLERGGETGVWAGLYCVPMLRSKEALDGTLASYGANVLASRVGVEGGGSESLNKGGGKGGSNGGSKGESKGGSKGGSAYRLGQGAITQGTVTERTIPAHCPGGALVFEHPQPVRHALTHKELFLHWVQFADVDPVAFKAWHATQALAPGAWTRRRAWHELGMPAPVRKFLETL